MEIDDIRYIYSDYQEELEPLAKVKLLSLNREGLTFILDDMAKDKQIVYGTQYWQCEIIVSNYYPRGYIKTFPIRYLYKIGDVQAELGYKEEDDSEYTIQDKFLKVDGEEIY